jgi:hypothetical protein
MTRGEARAQRAKAAANRRHAEALCAWDFLTRGDLHGEHAKRCVRPGGVVCSRSYDPGPVPEKERLYRGAEMGTLWGLNDIAAWQLAGWDVTSRRRAA